MNIKNSQWQYHGLALLLVILFFSFRLVDLGDNPAGFFCDEASIAFNARSILETGHDEHGVFFPVYFKAFDEYKPSLYIYTTALSIALFGDTPFAARLPATLFLTLAMLGTYMLLARKVHPIGGIIAVVLLGTEPWLHHFSHIAFSLSITPFLIMLSLLCWYKALEGSRRYVALTAFFFSMTFYIYPPARVFVPLLTIGLLFIYRQRYFYDRKGHTDLGIFFGIAITCSLPFFYYILAYDDFLSRLEYLNVFSTPFIAHAENYQWLKSTLTGFDYPIEQLNDTLTRGVVMVLNYFSYFSPKYLFLSGDSNLRFGTNHYGVLGWVTSLGLIPGLLLLLIRRNNFDKVLLWWILIYPLSASLTWENIPHSGRGIVGYIAMTMIAAMAWWELCKYLFQFKKLRVYAMTSVVVIGLSVQGYFSYSYFSYYLKEFSGHSGGWLQYGFAKMMQYIKDNEQRYEAVRIVSTGLHYQPYIFALYYSQYDTKDWQENKTLPWSIDQNTGPLNKTDYHENVLYVFAPVPQNLDPRFNLLEYGYWENGKEIAFGYFEFHQPPTDLSQLPRK